MTLSSIDNLLSKSLKRAGIYHQVASALVLERFSKILIEMLGVERAKRIKGMYIKNKKLYVACLHSVLAQDLKLRESEVLEKINQGKSEKLIEGIRYII